MARTSRAVAGNIISSRTRRPYSKLYYVVESADWSIKWDGKYITQNLNRQNLIKACITETYQGVRNQVLHLGSRNLFLPDTWHRINSSNKTVFYWTHGTEEDGSPANLAMIKAIPDAANKADIIHTPCKISESNLLRWGVSQDKIVVIPVGVDLNIFKPVTAERKIMIRQELGLPSDKLIIGSFQKDGVGWGDGMEPKWVKGPEVFVKVIDRLRRDHDIFVLLLGPARGYVKEALEKIGVPYRYFFLENYLEIPKYYNALDLYLVTSRAEGIPKAITEAMASGVPLVTTRVGIAPDIIEEGENGMLSEVDDVATIAEKAARIVVDKEMAGHMVKNALNTVKDYSWEKIARKFYDKIYKRLLSD
ncbi:glycosyltransferase family 4 protein [Chloroflexota bacterium]